MNKSFTSFFLIICFTLVSYGQSKSKVTEDFNDIYNNLSYNYIYLNDKHVDMDCIKKTYTAKIKALKSKDDVLLYFEYLLDEFYDSHLTLTSHNKKSYRLHSPIFSKTKSNVTLITQVWKSQIASKMPHNIIGAEILSFNGIAFNQMIDSFPTSCNDKTRDDVRSWIGNKILAGRYSEPRNLDLKLSNGKQVSINLDNIKYKEDVGFVSVHKIDNIGVIRINDALGKNKLISQFDSALKTVMNTDGLILDLRNTISGGNTYVARGIMGRFINKTTPYQKHWTYQNFSDQPLVESSSIALVSPRGDIYNKPLVVLANRWTGSMGEGLTIGFDAMKRAKIVGTEMAKLKGSMYGYSFKNRKYGYQLSGEKMYHLNSTPREDFIPEYNVKATTVDEDHILKKGISILKECFVKQ